MSIKPGFEPLLDAKAAADYLAVSIPTLATWRCTKRYDLKYYKIGRAVRYRRSDLEAFLNNQMQPDGAFQ